MYRPAMKYLKIPVLLIFTIFAVMLYSGPARAGDYSMQSNLNDMAELISKWSKQLSSGKMDPKAQEKLSELLSHTSQVLRDLSAKSGSDMDMEHHKKIEMMQQEWNPFDNADKM